MSPKDIRIMFAIVAPCWVGGWGYLMFRYPEFFAKINSRWGLSAFASPKSIAFIRWMGVIELALAGLSLIYTLVTFAFGLKWY
jgi:hypothetical protein